ncbi:speckle-type POZ protein-like [Schistocerca nitens]|uniref:speckle-type POZ protein-like n=1 Tax=Schistocerca nitens TaxID=7011 RepID=UPI002117A963|nr:speckle-type POZ protein-like [Schistocerca nitens]
MSYCSNCGQSTASRHGYKTPSSIAQVAAGTPKILKQSFGTRFDNLSSLSTWTVKGLSILPSDSTAIESIPFAHQNSSEWCMVLANQSDGLYLSFLLKKCKNGECLRAMLKADEIIPCGQKREVFPSKWYSLSQGGKTQQNLVRKLGTSKKEDEVILQCEIRIQCITQDKLPVAEKVEPYIHIVKGLETMFDREELTDFELHARGTVLKAHRALLSVQSPYFAAMLQQHTKEAKEGHVEVKDVSPEVLKQVLLYMYKGVAPALKDMPWDLLIAADKYQLHQLKGQCENHIASCLNVDNAAETAANAQVFSCDILWGRAVLYIKQNLCKVMSTQGWRDIIASRPEAVQCISELMAQ